MTYAQFIAKVMLALKEQGLSEDQVLDCTIPIVGAITCSGIPVDKWIGHMNWLVKQYARKLGNEHGA